MQDQSKAETKRILVVDDEQAVLFILSEILTEMDQGYEVRVAQNGDQALRKHRDTPFDLVITDLRMPGMGGVDLTAEVKALDPSTEVIWMTAYGCEQMRPDATRLAVHCCLEKPTSPITIRCCVLKALRDDGGDSRSAR